LPPTLLAVHAHPDDESSKGAGTMARYADEGVRTVIVTCTGGEAGEILNPAMDRPGVLERMPELRRQELAKALEILQVSAHYWLGYRDSGMADSEANGHPDAFAGADLDEATGRLVEILRRERPQVVLTYHATFSRRRMEAIHAGAVARGIDSPFAEWLQRWEENDLGPEPVVTTQIDVGGWLGRRRDALIAHATQIDPNSFWFAVPDEVIAEVYPWEDYTLARSLVATTEPETDLFAGIDPEA
jgi:mycothiol S-conjugate amidase